MQEEVNKKKVVSYSQFSTWFSCPKKYFYDYVKNLREREDSLHTCFGTSVHEAVQKYIETLYTKNAPEADKLNLLEIAHEAFDRELKKHEVKYEEDEYKDFKYDAQDIIQEFLKSTNRIKYFPSGKYEFLGSELKILQPIRNNLEFIALIDLALKDKKTNKVKIIDIKTSSWGWNKYMKEDEGKRSQILLYKALYSKKYDVPLSKIDVEFFILKRKLMENVPYPQNRIQLFMPSHNSPAVNQAIKKFTMFVDGCFTNEGIYNTNEEDYPKVPGKNKKNCKYCAHKGVRCFPTKADEKD